MAPKCDRSDSVWILFEVLQICHWDGFLPSSLKSSCKHCFPALICNLGTTTKDAWKQNRRAVLLPEVISDVSNFHNASGKGGKYGSSAKCIGNTAGVCVNRWPQGYWSGLDVFCCCSNAFVCCPQHDFGLFFFFFSILLFCFLFFKLENHPR